MALGTPGGFTGLAGTRAAGSSNRGSQAHRDHTSTGSRFGTIKAFLGHGEKRMASARQVPLLEVCTGVCTRCAFVALPARMNRMVEANSL